MNSLLGSISGIINVFIVILLLWIMYAILGVFLIKGKLGYCDIEDYYNVSKTMCEEMGEDWRIRAANFEHIFNAL